MKFVIPRSYTQPFIKHDGYTSRELDIRWFSEMCLSHTGFDSDEPPLSSSLYTKLQPIVIVQQSPYTPKRKLLIWKEEKVTACLNVEIQKKDLVLVKPSLKESLFLATERTVMETFNWQNPSVDPSQHATISIVGLFHRHCILHCVLSFTAKVLSLTTPTIKDKETSWKTLEEIQEKNINTTTEYCLDILQETGKR